MRGFRPPFVRICPVIEFVAAFALLMILIIPRYRHPRRIDNNPRIARGRPVGVLLSRISLKNEATTEIALYSSVY